MLLQSSGIVLIILAIGILVCSGLVIYMCFRTKAQTIVVQGDQEVVEGDEIVIKSPKRQSLAKENDAELFSATGKEQPSVMAMLPDERRSTAGAMPQYKLPIREFLIECDLE